MRDKQETARATLQTVTKGRKAGKELEVTHDILEAWLVETVDQLLSAEPDARVELIVQAKVIRGLHARLCKAIQGGKNAALHANAYSDE